MDSIHPYEEAHCGFVAPWSMLVAFKDSRTNDNWYRNAAEVELQLQKRILPSKSGKSSLRYFDGPSMRSYLSLPIVFETVYCRQVDPPKDCNRASRIEANRIGKSIKAISNETTKAYNPVAERHGRNDDYLNDHWFESVKMMKGV